MKGTNAKAVRWLPTGRDREVLYDFDAAGNRTNLTERGVVTNSLRYTVNSVNQYTRVQLGAASACRQSHRNIPGFPDRTRRRAQSEIWIVGVFA